MRFKTARYYLCSLLCLLLASVAHAEDKLPEVSHDGLHLVKDSELKALYMKPGASLAEYDKVALLACYVAFNKDWQRQYNDEEMDLMSQVTDKDMEAIRTRLATEFNKDFTDVLTQAGYQMVDKGASGVLIVQPAIINLEVTAPDTMAPGEMNFAADAGQMTLYMQLYDGKTGDLIARVIDPETVGGNFDIMQVRNSVTNTADENRTIKRWATILSEHLAKAGATPGAKN
ncbi:MAG: DUF3313 family protein [Pseudomonadota bacterium]